MTLWCRGRASITNLGGEIEKKKMRAKIRKNKKNEDKIFNFFFFIWGGGSALELGVPGPNSLVAPLLLRCGQVGAHSI